MLNAALGVFRRRSVVVAAAIGVSGALLTGCGSGPNQAGAAAIVGDREVSVSQLQKQVDTALANPKIKQSLALQGAPASLVAQVIVSREVQHLLLLESAEREGITVTEDQVNAELAKPGVAQSYAGQLALDPASQRDSARDQLICEALVNKYLNRLSATVDLVNADSKEQAIAVARQLAAGPAQAAAAIKAAGQNGAGGLALRGALVAQQDLNLVLGTQAGQVVALQTGPTSWTVWRVSQRSTTAPPVGPADAAASLGDAAVYMVGGRLTQPLAEQLGVRVNPRFGRWDPVVLSILQPGQSPSVIMPATLT